jgi:hypothetical protein
MSIRLPTIAAAMGTAVVLASCAMQRSPDYAASLINCENQAKGRHYNQTATCDEAFQASRSGIAPVVVPYSPAAYSANCENQNKGRHENSAIECEPTVGTAPPAPTPAANAPIAPYDTEGMKGHRNTVGQ